jgi:hypothetical protein
MLNRLSSLICIQMPITIDGNAPLLVYLLTRTHTAEVISQKWLYLRRIYHHITTRIWWQSETGLQVFQTLSIMSMILWYHSFLGFKSCVSFPHTRSYNLISGMAAACHWGVKSGKLMYPSMLGHVPPWIYMRHRPSELWESGTGDKHWVLCEDW